MRQILTSFVELMQIILCRLDPIGQCHRFIQLAHQLSRASVHLGAVGRLARVAGIAPRRIQSRGRVPSF